jgi:hypothetical protein
VLIPVLAYDSEQALPFSYYKITTIKLKSQSNLKFQLSHTYLLKKMDSNPDPKNPNLKTQKKQASNPKTQRNHVPNLN